MGGVALLLSAIGTYGLIAHDVSQRRREIGIRMALGAAPLRVIASVTRRGLTIAGLGMLLGLPLAWAMARAVAAALQGLAPVDPGSIALIVVLLAAVAAVASCLPAVRAARVRPARVLQNE
jgi:ABC-type antimicrobial peptide transport system permease subunit